MTREWKNTGGSMMEVLHQQMCYCHALDVSLVGIRVTMAAVPGMTTALPITPERARVIGKLLAVEMTDGSRTVVADPFSSERLWEIEMHPEDWHRLLKEMPREYLELTPTDKLGIGWAVKRVMGLEVRHT